MLKLRRHHVEFFKFFQWQRSVTPVSDPRIVAAAVAAYLALVGLGRAVIVKPLWLPRAAPALHNLILCLGSLLMFLGTAHESWRVREVLPTLMTVRLSSLLYEAVTLRSTRAGIQEPW